MEFVLIYRLIALVIVAYWLWQIIVAWRRPKDVAPPHWAALPIRLTRDRLIVAGVLGIFAALALFAYSFVMAS